jgi:hypothetical protein
MEGREDSDEQTQSGELRFRTHIASVDKEAGVISATLQDLGCAGFESPREQSILTDFCETLEIDVVSYATTPYQLRRNQ